MRRCELSDACGDEAARADRLGGRASAFRQQCPLGLQVNIHHCTRVSLLAVLVLLCDWHIGTQGLLSLIGPWLREKSFRIEEATIDSACFCLFWTSV